MTMSHIVHHHDGSDKKKVKADAFENVSSSVFYPLHQLQQAR
jgi:hypothetical protein